MADSGVWCPVHIYSVCCIRSTQNGSKRIADVCMRSAGVIHTVRSEMSESSRLWDFCPNSQDGKKTLCIKLLDTLFSRDTVCFQFLSSCSQTHCEIPENDVDSLDDVND